MLDPDKSDHNISKMYLNTYLTFFTLLLLQETLQNCVVVEVPSSYNKYYGYGKRKQVECENEVLSSNFSEKINPLKEFLEYLVINNTDSPEIAAGAFKLLRKTKYLKINNAGVKVLQKGCFQIESLLELNLTRNKIYEINADIFKNLGSLYQLDLSFNNIAVLSENSFNELRSLTYLNIEHNFLTQLPSGLIINCLMLRDLNLSFNKLLQIDNFNMTNQKTLATLKLSGNNLNIFDFSRLHSSRLLELHLNDNNLKGLNKVCFQTKLVFLNASNNRIESLSFSCYSEIQTLDLSQNAIHSFKYLYFQNVSISKMNLNGNFIGLSPIKPDVLNNLTTIKELYLSNNYIKEFNPLFFKRNSKLEILDLSKNYLQSNGNLTFPTSLQKLNISWNKFDSQINISDLINLKNLDMSHNNLNTVSFNFLKGLNVLFTLDLSQNNISEINLGSFRDLKFLRTLNLSSNKITKLLLGTFLGLNLLDSIDLSSNKLSDLNEGLFHNLRSLHKLNLNYNNINYSVVNEILSHVTTLQQIGLAGNGWDCNSLVMLLKEYKRIKIIDVGEFDLTNVDGVACKYQETPSKIQTNLEIALETIISKFCISNVLLSFIMIVLILSLILQYVNSSLKNKLKEKMSRFRSEQQIQLVDDC